MFSQKETNEAIMVLRQAQMRANTTGKAFAIVDTRNGLSTYPATTSYVRFKTIVEIVRPQ